MTASSPLARLSAAVVVGDSPGRTAQRVARASPAGAFDRPIFFVTSPVALGFGLGYLRLSPLPTYTYGGGWRELPVFTGREVQRVGSCPVADRPTIVFGLAFTNQFRSLPHGS